MPVREQMEAIDRFEKEFAKAKRVEDYCHIKARYTHTCNQITHLTEAVAKFTAPRNPREELNQQHDKMALSVLTKQKTRLEKQLSLLAEQIQLDVKVENTQTT